MAIMLDYTTDADTANHRIVLLSGTIMRFITIWLASLYCLVHKLDYKYLVSMQYLQLEPNLQVIILHWLKKYISMCALKEPKF